MMTIRRLFFLISFGISAAEAAGLDARETAVAFYRELAFGSPEKAAGFLNPPLHWGSVPDGMPAPPYSLFRVPVRSAWTTASGYRRYAADYYRTVQGAARAATQKLLEPQVVKTVSESVGQAFVDMNVRWVGKDGHEEGYVYRFHLKQDGGAWRIRAIDSWI